ncbi:MAG: nicotinate phosphoribosyltransferase [Armatimonadota bacterium]|nr:nicotinate phosphoribosyltransferase [Armatimonadota bacterium]
MRTASFDEIRAGRVTDVYFQRTWQILTAKDIHKRVTVEVKAVSLPDGYSWAVLAGVEEAVEALLGLPVDMRAMSEGTLFQAGEPIFSITGDYVEFGRLETAVLGFLCQASGIATKAARCKKAAGDRQVISFGARRMHPSLAPIIERYAYMGGCDGVSVILSAEQLGIPASGTMPHALILITGDVVDAVKLFDEIVPPDVKRIALVDTFCDEKQESIRAAEALGDRLYGVRLDTPGSRRGDFLKIIEEVRWELDIRGFSHVKIFVSGGIDEEKIIELNPAVDGYGVGTAISSASVIDLAMDIVEIEGKPVAKRGKKSGVKQVLRCTQCGESRLTIEGGDYDRECSCGGAPRELLTHVIRGGKLLRPLPSVHETRDYVIEQLWREWVAGIR